MKKTYALILTLICLNTVYAQIVNIPDANFKGYLLAAGVDTNNDGEIQTTEANIFTGTIYAISQNISDLTGIEAFINITYLNCSDNNISSIDVSSCSSLLSLHFPQNPVTSLNVFGCNYLITLNARSASLGSIDISTNTALEFLDMRFNELTDIDLSSNPNLWGLDLKDNELTDIDLSSNPNLESINLSYNQLTSLDVSNNTALYGLGCDNNQLNYLNVKNGNNHNFSFFTANNNPNLNCIEVDDVAYSNTNWTLVNSFFNVDITTSFSTVCSVGIDEEINNVVSNIYPNPAAHTINIEVTENNLSYQLTDLTGKVVKQEALSKNENNINVSTIPNGFYALSVYNTLEVVATEKLIVAH